MESVISELGWTDAVELTINQFPESEEENREAEKEENTKKEISEFSISLHNWVAFKPPSSDWLEDSQSYQSWVTETPSPPPDFRS